MNDQPSSAFGREKRRVATPDVALWCGFDGSRRVTNSASNDTTASTPKIARGPTVYASSAPSGSASTGPVAMKARDRPLRRAAPSGSAVARACVDRLSAAKHRPQVSRSGSSAQNPESVA
ncbi:hypothetical protein D3C72_1517600 [compost metagenome]